jgi:hypothetical protein
VVSIAKLIILLVTGQWRTSEHFSFIIIANLEIKVSKYLKALFISAGDGVKFNLPMAAATTVLSQCHCTITSSVGVVSIAKLIILLVHISYQYLYEYFLKGRYKSSTF